MASSRPEWYGGGASAARDQSSAGSGEADLLDLGGNSTTNNIEWDQPAQQQTSFQDLLDRSGPACPSDPYVNTAPSSSIHVAEEYGEVGLHPSARTNKPTGSQVGGAAVAGGLAGAVVAGPLLAVAGAAGAAYAATTKGGVGDLTRNTGSVVAKVGDSARHFDEEHKVTEKSWAVTKSGVESVQKLDERHGIVENTRSTLGSIGRSARTFNEEHKVVDNTKRTVGTVWSSARNFDNQHKVTENVGKGLVAAGSAAGSFLGSMIRGKDQGNDKSSGVDEWQ